MYVCAIDIRMYMHACTYVCRNVHICTYVHTYLWYSSCSGNVIRMYYTIYISLLEYYTLVFIIHVLCVEFMNFFKEEFFTVVQAKVIASQLVLKGVFPQSLGSRIMKGNDGEGAFHLYRHCEAQFDYASLEVLCQCMRDEFGYPEMNALGKKMLDCLKASEF